MNEQQIETRDVRTSMDDWRAFLCDDIAKAQRIPLAQGILVIFQTSKTRRDHAFCPITLVVRRRLDGEWGESTRWTFDITAYTTDDIEHDISHATTLDDAIASYISARFTMQR